MKTMLKTIFSELVIGNLWHLRVRVLAFFIQLQVVTVFFFGYSKIQKEKTIYKLVIYQGLHLRILRWSNLPAKYGKSFCN